MHSTKTIKNFTETELKKGVNVSGSWHEQYQDSAYIFVGNLHYEMNEGDIAIVFSQYGEIVDVHLIRDKSTGKSKGFAFLAYEDQRSTALAVDNFNNSDVCGRTLRVDHVKKFRPPKEYLELKEDDPDFMDKLYKPSGADGKGWGKYREVDEEERRELKKIKKEMKKIEKNQEKIIKNREEFAGKIVADEDERWEKLLIKGMESQDDKKKEKKEKKHKHKEKKHKKKDKKKEKEEEKEKDKKKQKHKHNNKSRSRSRS